jgi:VanZ family protein
VIKKIIKILLVVIWMGVIFSFSSDNKNASDNKSSSVIITIYHFFNNKELSKQEEKQIIEKYAYPIRKLAHFTEYFILGLLVIS